MAGGSSSQQVRQKSKWMLLVQLLWSLWGGSSWIEDFLEASISCKRKSKEGSSLA